MIKINKDDVIVVWFSCGAASAVAAKKTIEKYGDQCTVRVVNNPVINEHNDNNRFLLDAQDWLKVPIETAKNSKYPDADCVNVWADRKFMSSPSGAPCTLELKKNARKQWERQNKHDHHVLGFTFEEKHRHDRFCMTERPILPVLIEQRITKKDCYGIIRKAGLKLPEIYSLGFPNANCIGCVKATSPTYWNLVREKFPEIFKERSVQSRQIGAKLTRVKGNRIYLDQLKETDKGRPLKNDDFECGIFCEEVL